MLTFYLLIQRLNAEFFSDLIFAMTNLQLFQFVQLEAVISSIMDEFTVLRSHKTKVFLVSIVLIFISSIPCTTQVRTMLTLLPLQTTPR